ASACLDFGMGISGPSCWSSLNRFALTTVTVSRKNHFDVLFRLREKIFCNRDERFADRRRTDLVALRFHKGERKQSSNEQDIDARQNVLEDRQFLIYPCAGNNPEKRWLGFLENNFEHHQFLGEPKACSGGRHMASDSYCRCQPAMCQ